MLNRARRLDDAATIDERVAGEIALRLPALRASAKAARERADRASTDEREVLTSRAEELEAELVVSEAEVAEKRRQAAEQRLLARTLRARAVTFVREPSARSFDCDVPYSIHESGRKVYHVECFE